MTTSRLDLTLDDLLGDPMTHAVMKADRVDPSELEAMLRALAPRIALPAGRTTGDAHDGERVPSDRQAVGRFLRAMDRGRNEMPRCLSARSRMRSQSCGASPPW
jgi:hypothetical protein